MDLKEQMEKLSEAQKERIILQYLKVRSKANEKYKKELKDNPDFIQKNREFAKNYYQNNKEKKFEYYDNNKEKIRLRARYNYYKQRNRLDDYLLKYSEEAHNFMCEAEINKIKKPSNVVEELNFGTEVKTGTEVE